MTWARGREHEYVDSEGSIFLGKKSEPRIMDEVTRLRAHAQRRMSDSRKGGAMGKKIKIELRQDMSRVLASLDRRWVQAASSEICENLRTLFRKEIDQPIEHILAWSAHFPGEVDLSSLITGELDAREVYLPRALPDRSMTFVSIDTDWSSKFEEGWRGLPQPVEKSGSLYSPDWGPSTLVLVPGLAFDGQGGRLGRGGGYYDRFLADPRMAEALVIGVCWSLQLVPSLPHEAHDIGMDWVCHEREYFAAGTLRGAELFGERT